MLRFFRKNDPYRIVPIFLILIVIRVGWLIIGLPASPALYKWELLGFRLSTGVFMYRDTFDYTAPLAAGLYRWITWTFGTSVWPHFVLSTFLVIFQAATLNRILLSNKAFEENNYLPAFLYMIFSAAIPEFYVLSPQLLSVTFLILTLNLIFRRIDNMASDELFLLAGVYVGLAMLFYLPSIAFFISFLLSFIIFSTAILRRISLFVLGVCLMVLVVWSYSFWYGYSTEFFKSFFLDGILKPKTHFISYQDFFLSNYVSLAVFGISFFAMLWARLTNFQSKIAQVFFFFFLAAVGAFFLSAELSGAEFVLLLPPAAFFLTHSFLRLRRRIFKFLVPYLVVLGLLIYPAWLNTEKYVPYEYPSDAEKLMIIGDQMSEYHGYKHASPFIDEYVSKRRLGEMDQYTPSALIFEILAQDKPDIILDQWGYWDQIKNTYPFFTSQYEETTTDKYVRINN